MMIAKIANKDTLNFPKTGVSVWPREGNVLHKMTPTLGEIGRLEND